MSSPNPPVDVLIAFHCINKTRVNDEHSYVRTKKRVSNAKGANKDIGKLRSALCNFCRGRMIEGDAYAIGRKVNESGRSH
jgi:hypothetical protein